LEKGRLNGKKIEEVRKNMREFLAELGREGSLLKVTKEVDLRNISSLISQANGPIMFQAIKDYKQFSVVSGFFRNREILARVLNCSPRRIAQRFEAAINATVSPVTVKEAPVKEIIRQGKEMNLADLPIPLQHVGDGGPYISGAVLIADDPLREYGINLGFYRLMYRTKNQTGIAIDLDSDLGRYYERALKTKKPLPVSVAIGVHPAIMAAAAYKAPLGTSEYTIAGSLMQQPIKLTRGITNQLLIPANAEIVLEGEILPMGWVEQEGPFGEFTGYQSENNWNPTIKFNCMLMRQNPIYYALGMPWENNWLLATGTEALVLKAITNAGVKVHEVRSTIGGACLWYIIASIEKQAGGGKNAILAALSTGSVKLAIITDHDVDIFNQDELDRAIIFRVRPQEDVMIIKGARAYNSDPSVTAWSDTAWKLPRNSLTTTSKIGIDATIPEDIPIERYQKAAIFREMDVTLEDYL